MLTKNSTTFIYLLASMYLAGIIGLSNTTSQSFFKFLTPFHLLFSFIILIIFQVPKEKYFWIFLIFCVSFGYSIEVLGVKTGLIFGNYKYNNTLGVKFFNVPPIIGINWFLMVYCIGTLIQVVGKDKLNTFKKTMVGASILTMFDFVAEPVAINQNMWDWFGLLPPLQNYLAWFLVSFVLLYSFFKSPFKKNNPIAPSLFIFQILFFIVLRLLLVFNN